MIKQRTCIACRAKKSKEEYIRIVAENKMAIVDETKKMNTRGMYICNNKKCIDKLLKAKDISKCIKIDATKESVIKLLKNLGE